jgi:hypothetical protein
MALNKTQPAKTEQAVEQLWRRVGDLEAQLEEAHKKVNEQAGSIARITKTKVIYDKSFSYNPETGVLSVNPAAVDINKVGGVMADIYVRLNGTTPLTGDWDIGTGRILKTEKVQARSSAGLLLGDISGNGITIANGGDATAVKNIASKTFSGNGTQTFDVAPTTPGAELIGNTSFDTDSWWTKGGTATIHDGHGDLATPGDTKLSGEIVTEAGETYKLVFTTSNGTAILRVESTTPTHIYIDESIETPGTYTRFFTAVDTGTRIAFYEGSY